MIDKEKLRYDLAMQAAAVMTLRDNHGNPPDRMLVSFELAYNRLLRKNDSFLNSSSRNFTTICME